MARIACLLLMVVCLLALPTAAGAAPRTLSEDGAAPELLADPGTGRTLAVWSRTSTDHGGALASDIVARVLDRSGRPVGPLQTIGTGAIPDPAYNGGSQLSVVLDRRRHRWLVAWSGHEPGMARASCRRMGGPFDFTDYSTCASRHREIVVRVLDGLGRPIGEERPVTATGAADDPDAAAVIPSAAYDARNDAFLVAYADATDSQNTRGVLRARRLRADGSPLGGQRLLALRPQADSINPLVRLAARPRGGFLVAFTWGEGFGDRHLFLRRLTPGGQTTGSTRRLTSAGGPGAGGIDLVPDAAGRRALILWSLAKPGASSGFRATPVDLDGDPVARTASLPYTVGVGPMAAAPEAEGRGWLYAFAREREAPRQDLAVQQATRTGRPVGDRRRVSAEGEFRPQEPAVAPAGPDRFLMAWTEYRPNGASTRVRAAVVRSPR